MRTSLHAEGCQGGGKVASEAHRQLALDADRQVACAPQGGVVSLHGRREDAATARIVDAEIGLHDRGGAADLVSRNRTAPRGSQPLVQRVLDRVSLILVGRSQVDGKAGERVTLEAMRGEQVGCGGDVHVSPPSGQ